jgi:hypothetical protein
MLRFSGVQNPTRTCVIFDQKFHCSFVRFWVVAVQYLDNDKYLLQYMQVQGRKVQQFKKSYASFATVIATKI